MSESRTAPPAGDRLAKVIARSGLCSRRDAEGWIAAGRVTVNGKKVITPAFNVTDRDKITVDGQPLAVRQGTRLWLYHKPPGLVVTEKDPQGRPTVFDAVEELGLPRVVSVGRLDINTEGLLLLTNDGGLKRVLELPETGWLRRYRVRAHGTVTQAQLDSLQHGIEVEGIRYGEIEATLEREQGANVWLAVALREGKNREVRNVLEAVGLTVNRLIRVSYGPFQLGDIPPGEVETVKARVLRDQLGRKLAEAAGVDFDSDMPEPMRSRPPQRGGHPSKTRNERGSFSGQPETRRAPRMRADDNTPAPRRIHFEGGESITEFRGKPAGRNDRPERGDRPDRGDRTSRGPRREGDDRPARGFGPRSRPSRDFGEKSRTPEDGFERRPRRRDAEAGGQADARQSRPYREARPARGGFEGKGAPRGDSRGPRPDRPQSDRPKFDRSGSDRPRSDRPRSDRPEGGRSVTGEGRPQRPAFDKPARPGGKPGARPPSRPGAGGPRKPGPSDRPRGGPGGRPTGGRPSGRPGGRPPAGPRKPRSPKS